MSRTNPLELFNDVSRSASLVNYQLVKHTILRNLIIWSITWILCTWISLRNLFNWRADIDFHHLHAICFIQIGRRLWCQRSVNDNVTINGCNMSCANLVDDDIADDVSCALKAAQCPGLSDFRVAIYNCKHRSASEKLALFNKCSIALPLSETFNTPLIETCRPSEMRKRFEFYMRM